MTSRSSSRTAVAFVHETLSTFIMQDLEILSDIAQVTDVRFAKMSDIPKLVRGIRGSDIVYVWFAAGRAAALSILVGRALRKKVIVVAGGTEVARDSSFRGRSMRSRFRFLAAVRALNAADLVTCVSEFTKAEVESISHPKSCKVVYNGVDVVRLERGGATKGEEILTIHSGALWIKGIDRFVRLAEILPHRRFLIVGPLRDELSAQVLPGNVVLTGRLGRSELLPVLQSARFYCQLSRYESFGVALAEAMACECAPIASSSGALPEIVDGTGFLVSEGDPDTVARLIEENWSAAPDIGRSARDRVSRSFTSERRKEALRNVIEGMGRVTPG
jgi:glycosyltransferase involved in cell wall biosynthesis